MWLYSAAIQEAIKLATVQGSIPETCLYVDDARSLAINVTRGNSSGSYVSVTPDSATIKVDTTDGTAVLAETAAGVSGSQVYYPINTDNITGTARRLVVTWKVVYGDDIAYLLQYLTIQEK